MISCTNCSYLQRRMCTSREISRIRSLLLMHGTILTFIKFTNFDTQHLNKPTCLFHCFCCTAWHILEPLCVYKPGFNTDKCSIYHCLLIIGMSTFTVHLVGVYGINLFCHTWNAMCCSQLEYSLALVFVATSHCLLFIAMTRIKLEGLAINVEIK